MLVFAQEVTYSDKHILLFNTVIICLSNCFLLIAELHNQIITLTESVFVVEFCQKLGVITCTVSCA